MDKETKIIRIDENHLSNSVGDELILLSLSTGDYLGLNSVGAAIWMKLTSLTTANAIIEELMEEYDVDRETCEQQTMHYLEKMSGLGLIKFEA